MKHKEKAGGPRIGITLDYEEGGGYSKMAWYALRENYCSAVSRFGAIPLPLPHELEQVECYLDMLDGLVITGGAFDVSPELYGESGKHATVTTKDRRTRFEWAITQGAIERKLPILGICGGQQLLNVVLGGTLIQHIPDAVPGALEHEQKNPRTEPGHEVKVVEGTLLHRILNSSPRRGEVRRGASLARDYPLDTALQHARSLRKNMTDAEALLWQLLRGEQLGAKFRKQHPVGHYIADFACLKSKIIIELDGGQYNDASVIKKDEARTRFLEQQGFTVLRFWNNDVLQQTDAVLERIYEVLHGKTELLLPPQGGGWEGGNLAQLDKNAPTLTLPLRGREYPKADCNDITIAVNSAHHQAVAKVAPGAVVNAVAPDGVIEGIELPESAHPFCLGVQWHPEYFVTEADECVINNFVQYCKDYG